MSLSHARIARLARLAGVAAYGILGARDVILASRPGFG